MTAAPDLVAAAEQNTPRADLDIDTYQASVMIGLMLAFGIVSALLAASCFMICSAAGFHLGHGAAGEAAGITFVLCFFGWTTGFLGFCIAFLEVFPGPASAGGHAPGLVLPYCGPAEDRQADGFRRELAKVLKIIWHSLCLTYDAAGEQFSRSRWGAGRRTGPAVPAGEQSFCLRAAAMLMPADQARDWLAEVASMLHETAEDQRDTIRRDYLRGAPRVIVICRSRQMRRWTR